MNTSIWQNFLQPKSVAVIGATDKAGSVGHSVLRNLTNGLYEGGVCPVNPKRDSVLGYKCYPSIGAIHGGVDLAIITTPSSTVPDLITQCGEAGVKSVVVLSAGFEEFGEAGHRLGERVLENARKHGVRIIGPNCLGLISPRCGLNATFANGTPQNGSVAFISQSGALGTAILDWSIREHVGFSAFISTGAMLDIGWADLIDALAEDRQTRSIVMYMESVGDARSFVSAARELALVKPIIVLKAGRHEEGILAARSHTGAMAGSDDVLDAAFERCGVLRVQTIAELFYMAEVLAKQPRPNGPRITIVTNAGGPGVLAADALADAGGSLTKISADTIDTLDKILPPSWSRTNPIDTLGDATPERYAHAVKYAVNDPNTDAVLAILTPQAMTEPTETALMVAQIERPKGKPLLTSWMGGRLMEDAITALQSASIPNFPFPDTAIKIGHYMWRYTQVLQNLYETPQLLDDPDSAPSRDLAANILSDVRQAGRTLLTEFESKQLLKSYNIPIVDTYLAGTADSAAVWANKIGYPVVLKLNSERITHKSDVGGVQLNLQNEEDVRLAYSRIETALKERGLYADFGGVTVQKMVDLSGFELILGSRADAQFGPVLLFGTGGKYTEIVKDYALGLPPLNSTLAKRIIEKTQAFKILQGARGEKPVNMADLERLLITFSNLVVDHPAIREIEINPLIASSTGIIALDARVTLYEEVPDVRLTIQPYPKQYVGDWTTPKGVKVTFRPIRPEDEPAMIPFHHRLSDQSVYQRYFSIMGIDARTAHERLSRMCFIDYARQMAFVVEKKNPGPGESEILGIGRLIRERGSNDAEFALLVPDDSQGQGYGTELLRRLIEYGRDSKIDRIIGDILPGNEVMRHLCEKAGFQLTRDFANGVVKAIWKGEM